MYRLQHFEMYRGVALASETISFYRCHLICMLSYSETIVRVLCIEYAMCDINRSKLSYLILAEIVLEGNSSIGTLGMR